MNRHILFVHNYRASFVRIDHALLNERYAVREWYQLSRAINLPAIFRAVAQSDLVFGWFASWHTFFPVMFARMLKRPSMLVVGGYDTARMPEIGYGNHDGGFKHRITLATLRAANQLITNSRYTRDEVIRNAQVDAQRVTVIHHGIDAEQFSPMGEKENVALTVGHVDRTNLQRKGLESFVRAAALVPELPFVLIGPWQDDAIHHLRQVATPNVRFTGWVDHAELQRLLGRGRIYVQASRHEGFSLSVAEAMLCECLPVVTRAGALPEVVGDLGIYIDSSEPGAVADGVRRALASDPNVGAQARARVAREFPLERRRVGLFNTIDSLLNNAPNSISH